jgi:hypothetical protein
MSSARLTPARVCADVRASAKELRPHEWSGVKGFSRTCGELSDADLRAEAIVRVAPGDLLVHHALALHRAGPNLSEHRKRRAIGAVFYGASARVDEGRREEWRLEIAARTALLAGQASTATPVVGSFVGFSQTAGRGEDRVGSQPSSYSSGDSDA